MSQDFLRQMILFKELDDTELVELLTLCNTRAYKGGSRIFSEGDPAARLYMIKAGEVRISRMIPGAGEEALAVLKPGDFFGEMALMDESVRSANAIAHSDCTLMEMAIKELQNLLASHETIAVKFLWAFSRILSARLRATNDRFYGLFAMSQFFK